MENSRGEDQKPCVVFVDDEPPILRSLERTFRRELFDIRVTEDPEQAIAWAQEPHVRLIISDYRMPQMTGIDLLKRIKEIRPEVKRFILSGYSDESIIKEALDHCDIHQYLLKPWNNDDLRARILAAVA